jgi:hypothetical protein
MHEAAAEPVIVSRGAPHRLSAGQGIFLPRRVETLLRAA